MIINTRKEYEMAYRAFRKFWKQVDNGTPMRQANAYYDNVVRSYPLSICDAALRSTRAKRTHDYNTKNPLYCGKVTLPKKMQS